MARTAYEARLEAFGAGDETAIEYQRRMLTAINLLRDQNDFGVIVLCDPRIRTKNYGAMFLKCLEPMTPTDSLSDVKRFLSEHEARVEAAVGGD